MVEYIKELTNFLKGLISGNEVEGLTFIDLSEEVLNEVEKLDPKYFTADARCKFVIVRAKIKALAKIRGIGPDNKTRLLNISNELIEILGNYQGYDSTLAPRKFDFITDTDLKNIIERDYNELSLFLLPDGAWKSTVVMSGSILEAILFDVLFSDPVRETASLSCSSTPKKAGNPLPIDKWKLVNLIDVAVETGILSAARAKAIDQILRDYRNFIHPKKELRTGHPCTEAEALMSKGALDAVCNHLAELFASP